MIKERITRKVTKRDDDCAAISSILAENIQFFMEFLDIKFLDIFRILRGFLGTNSKKGGIKFLDIFSQQISSTSKFMVKLELLMPISSIKSCVSSIIL